MSQVTPGKRARDRYIPFNNDPKNVGTRSGMVMPQNLPRREGLEDPAAYFDSPDGPSGTNRRDTINSAYSRTTYATTPGARTTWASDDEEERESRGDMETPGTARRVSRAGRGRMSDLDFEEGMGGGDDLLQDEDDLAMATPGSYFPGSNPPSVSLPSGSRLNRSSPATHTSYDALPSPSKSRPSKDPRKSHLVPRSAPNSAHKKSGLSNGRTARASESEEERTRSGSVSDNEPARTPSPESEPEDEAEAEAQMEAEPQADYSFEDEPGHSNFGADDTVDLGDDEVPMAPMDDYDVQGAEEEERRQARADSASDEENDGGYDQEPQPEMEMEMGQDRSEDEQESEGEQRPVQKKKGKGKENAKTAAQRRKETAAARRKSPAPRRERRERSQSAQPRRARLSELDANGNGITGNFLTRRSGRQHIKPLEYWRGEKVVYAPGPGLAVVSEVLTIPEEAPVPFAARNKRRGHRSASATATANGGGKRKRRGGDSDDEEENEEGWDEKTEPTGLIQDFPNGAECHRKIACPKALLVPRLVQGGSFKYQKVFGEGGFMAAGVVFIPVGEKKNTKPSKDNAYVFYVIQGAVQVTIYRTSFVMAPGSQFLVPRGNDYCIENISPNKEAQLFFAQARKILADEEEEDGIPESQGGPAPASMSQEMRGESGQRTGKKVKGKGKGKAPAKVSKTKGKRLQAVREENESGDENERGSETEQGSGSEQEEVDPEPVRKKKAKSKR
ncbi:hypothetical protein IAR50_006986 [Cryptococcus sp. DSM 104548]